MIETYKSFGKAQGTIRHDLADKSNQMSVKYAHKMQGNQRQTGSMRWTLST